MTKRTCDVKRCGKPAYRGVNEYRDGIPYLRVLCDGCAATAQKHGYRPFRLDTVNSRGQASR